MITKADWRFSCLACKTEKIENFTDVRDPDKREGGGGGGGGAMGYEDNLKIIFLCLNESMLNHPS